jgi:hypothetical protein
MSYAQSEYTIDEPLTFAPPIGAPLTAQVLTIRVVEEDDEIVECHLALQVLPDIYLRIDSEALFNLQPEVRGPLGHAFNTSHPIELDVALDAELLPVLNEGITSTDEAVNRLFKLSQSGATSQLLDTRSWYALHVKQAVELPPDMQEAGTLKAGYSTIWADTDIGENDDSPFEEDALEVLAEFFRQIAWPFQRVPGQETLDLNFQGDSAMWQCYAHVRRAGTQCAFYSVCPEQISPERRAAVAEYITRANFGLIVGNFEMNWASGEVRFKTSLDVEGDRLSLALVRQLVESNVSLMDQYLPGILSVNRGEVTPAEAIVELER